MYMYLSIQETHLVVAASDLPAYFYKEQLGSRVRYMLIEVALLKTLHSRDNRTSMCD